MELGGSRMDPDMPTPDLGASTSAPTRGVPILKPLCNLCKSFDFESLGLQDCNFKLVLDWERTLDVARYEPTMPNIEKNAPNCVICREVIDFYEKWKAENRASLARDKYVFEDEWITDKPTAPDHAHYFIDDLMLGLSIPKEGKLVRMFVQLTIGVLGDGRVQDSVCPILQFQKWGPAESGEGVEEQPYNGRWRAPRVDLDRLFGWKNACDEKHGDYCKSDSNIMEHLESIRLIDVKKKCVVEKKRGQDEFKYVALSHVWGTKESLGELKMPRLVKNEEGREEDLRKPGALTRKKVLRTIDDAMTLVAQGLNENYLWVDCLCILQTDDSNSAQAKEETDADQAKFIGAMDSIYACASVTIVAAAGDNANVGLPGINSISRVEQKPFTIESGRKMVSLVRTLDLEGSGEEGYWEYRYVGGSTWDTRGWTFQEKIFSRRTLIFTKMQVYWECQRATWCEDSVWETTKPPSLYRHCLNADEFRLPWNNKSKRRFEERYRKLVEEYTGRKLTKESDGLNAFKGILNALGIGGANHEFLCGLPLSFLASALKWHYHRYNMREFDLKRREDTQGYFPSWSWVGWVGKVELGSNLNAGMADLHIFYLTAEKEPLLREVPHAKNVLDSASLLNLLSMKKIRPPNTRIDVNMNDGKVQEALPKSVASNILFFWSSAAKFQIRVGHKTKQNPKDFVFSCATTRGDRRDVLVKLPFMDVPSQIRLTQEDEFKLVVIGTLDKEHEEAIARRSKVTNHLALLVCKEEDGIAYQRGLVHIHFREWKRCKRVWELVCLG